MKRFFILAMMACAGLSVQAQTPQKSGHLNFQEIVYLMPEMDSANVVLEKYGKELNDMFTSMQQEYQSKVSDYQAMNANWTPAVLEAKTKEIQEMEVRIQTFQQNAYQDLQMKQNELFQPLYQRASEAVRKVAKSKGLVYVFDVSGLLYYDDQASEDLGEAVRKELGIPLDKKLNLQKMQQQQQQAPAGAAM